jgi:hypothetical protein
VAGAASHDKPEGESELVAVLREQLAAERQAHAEVRRIIAGLVERILAIEAPRSPQNRPRRPTSSRVGVSPGPMPQARKRAHGGRGGVGCSEDRCDEGSDFWP